MKFGTPPPTDYDDYDLAIEEPPQRFTTETVSSVKLSRSEYEWLRAHYPLKMRRIERENRWLARRVHTLRTKGR